MNTYQGGGISQGKIISIKRHFTSLIFEIISPLVSSNPLPLPLISIHTRLQSQKWCIYKIKYIIQHLFSA